MCSIWGQTLWLMLLLPNVITTKDCPSECSCDADELTVTCQGSLLLTLPDVLPDGYDILVIRNSSIRSIPKNSFRKMEELREFRVENAEHLDTLEKFSFKSLKKLRVISFTNCPRLNEIPKGVFTGIANKQGLKIIFNQCLIQRIHGGAFRHANNIRELSISGSDLALSRHSFASITQLDFLTLSGVVLMEPQLFSNSSRFHIIHIKESHLDIPPHAFEGLSHVHQLLIQRCRIHNIATSAFDGLETVETIELFDNQIGSISARAFSGVINLGRLRIARNTIKQLDTTESIFSEAIQTRVEENTIDCNCQLKWLLAHEDRRLVDSNYCGSSGVYRSIRTFLRHNCNNSNYTSRCRPRQKSTRIIRNTHSYDSSGDKSVKLPYGYHNYRIPCPFDVSLNIVSTTSPSASGSLSGE